MPTTAQVKRFSKRVKSRLLNDEKSITALARELGLPRNTVSMAINRSCFPRVVGKIKETLKIK